MARKQVGEVRDYAGISPAATPVDTFVRPAREAVAPPANTDDTTRLAQVLSSFDTKLQGWLDERHGEFVKKQEAAAEGRLAGLTFDEAKRLRTENKLAEHQDPWYLAAINKGYATMLARSQVEDLTRRLKGESTAPEGQPSNAYDRTKYRSADEWAKENIKGTIEELGADRHMLSGYLSVIQPFTQAARNEDVKQRVEQYQDTAANAVTSNWVAAYKAAKAQNLSPQATADALFSTYDAHTNAFRLDRKTQDVLMFKLAQRLAAEGDSETATAILRTRRKDGSVLGDKPEFLAHGEQLIEASKREEIRRTADTQYVSKVALLDKVHAGTATDAEIEAAAAQKIISPQERTTFMVAVRDKQRALIKEREAALLRLRVDKENAALSAADNARLMQEFGVGSLYDFTQRKVLRKEIKDGVVQDKEVELKRSDVLAQIEDDYLKRESPRIALRDKETVAQKFSREVRVFAANGIKPKAWEHELRAGALAAAEIDINKSDWQSHPGVANVITAARRFEQMYATNRSFASSMVSKDDEVFYTAYRLARTDLGWDERRAATAAIRAYHNRNDGRHAAALSNIDFVSATQSATSRTYENFTEILPRVRELSELFLRTGMVRDGQDAVRRAVDEMEKRSIVVNRTLVNTGDAAVPPGYGEVLEKYVDWWAKKNGTDAGDLTVRFVGRGDEFQIWDKRVGGVPVLSPEKSIKANFIVGRKEIAEWRRALAEEAAKKNVKSQENRRDSEEYRREKSQERPAVPPIDRNRDEKFRRSYGPTTR